MRLRYDRCPNGFGPDHFFDGHAIIWKIALMVGFLWRSNGIGFQIHLYFQLCETGYVLACTLNFVTVTLLRVTKARATWWRQSGPT